MSNKAYNIALVQTTAAKKATNANGKAKITFRAKTTMRGREIERTVVAQGAAAEQIAGMVKKGASLNLRCLFERAPANEDGSQGGEYLTVVGLPRAA